MRKTDRDSAIAELVKREGGYVDHPADRGGPTRYGITQEVARHHGYNGDMRKLSLERACDIYQKKYWDVMHLDAIYRRAPELAITLMDFGVHSGTARAARHLQRALNVLCNKGQRWPVLETDGRIGERTLMALDAMISLRGTAGGIRLAVAINALRLAWLVDLAERDVSQQAFAQGWIDRVVGLTENIYASGTDDTRRRGGEHAPHQRAHDGVG